MSFAYAFGISSSGSWGAYVGSYGNIAWYGDNGNGYDNWRHTFWEKLVQTNPVVFGGGRKYTVKGAFDATMNSIGPGQEGASRDRNGELINKPTLTYKFYGSESSYFEK
jgi:hypothetical protein